jgi:hypothetical protein
MLAARIFPLDLLVGLHFDSPERGLDSLEPISGGDREPPMMPSGGAMPQPHPPSAPLSPQAEAVRPPHGEGVALPPLASWRTWARPRV